MYTLGVITALAILLITIGRVIDLFLVKTGRVSDNKVYTLDEVKEIKQRGILYAVSANIRLSRVPEVAILGYKEKQVIYSKL